MSESLTGISSLSFSKVFPAPGANDASPVDARKAMQESRRRLREAHARGAQACNGRSGEELEREGTPAPVTPAAEE